MSELILPGPTLLDPVDRLTVGPESGLRERYHSFMDKVLKTSFVDENWAVEPTAILPYGKRPREVNEYWVVGPGLGSRNSRRSAKELRRYVQPTAWPAHLEISTSGTDPDKLQEVSNQHIDTYEIDEISLLGQSLGLARLLHAIRDRDDIHVGRIIGDGSPASLESVRLGRTIRRIGPMIHKSGYRGGYYSSLTAAFVREMDANGIRPVLQNARTAKHKTITGPHPHRLPKELAEIWEYFGPRQLLQDWRRFEGKFDGNTKVALCYAEDPTRDPAVYVRRACEEWVDFFAHFTDDIEVFWVPNSGHSETIKSLATVASGGWFARTNLQRAA